MAAKRRKEGRSVLLTLCVRLRTFRNYNAINLIAKYNNEIYGIRVVRVCVDKMDEVSTGGAIDGIEWDLALCRNCFVCDI